MLKRIAKQFEGIGGVSAEEERGGYTVGRICRKGRF